VRVSGHTAHSRISFAGDVTSLTIAWDGVARVHSVFHNPGLARLVRDDDLRTAGRHRLRVTVAGGAGKGRGTRPRRSATGRRTAVVR